MRRVRLRRSQGCFTNRFQIGGLINKRVCLQKGFPEMKPRAFALANNDYVHVAWDFGVKLEKCDGFAVYRIEKGKKPVPLPVFGRDKNGKRRKVSCEEEPIRKYNWRD